VRVTTRHVKDALPGATYEYDLYEFSVDDVTLVARSYTFDAEQAHILRKEVNGRALGLTAADVRTGLFVEAAAYLRAIGKRQLQYLSIDAEAYVDLPGTPSSGSVA
jgi:hypothetical protein